MDITPPRPSGLLGVSWATDFHPALGLLDPYARGTDSNRHRPLFRRVLSQLSYLRSRGL